MTRNSTATRERILAAAETLFADHGFAGASMRRVTAAAGVNLAAVNYHFGSKDRLIEEVFRRRLDELNQRRLQALDALPEEGRTLEDVLGAFIGPALALALDTRAGNAFVRVLARAYVERDSDLRQFLAENYGEVMHRFTSEFARLLPHLDKTSLYLRLDIVAGALTYAMADFGISRRRDEVDAREHRQQTTQHLIRFAAAGLRQA